MTLNFHAQKIKRMQFLASDNSKTIYEYMLPVKLRYALYCSSSLLHLKKFSALSLPAIEIGPPLKSSPRPPKL